MQNIGNQFVMGLPTGISARIAPVFRPMAVFPRIGRISLGFLADNG
jgi:hypothetical protein